MKELRALRERVVRNGIGRRATAEGGGTGQTGAWRLVYQHIRGDIVQLKLPPGHVVSEKELSVRFGLSRTPVREAIQRLADEGLVDIFPQAGTFVSHIPLEQLPEAIVIRKALEGVTVAAAARKATRSQLLMLASIIEQQREAATANDQAAFHAADEAFHAKIAEIAGFPGIWKLVLQVKTQVDRFRRTTLSQPHRMDAVVAEHQQVLDGLNAANPGAATDAMNAHLDAVLPRAAGGAEADR